MCQNPAVLRLLVMGGTEFISLHLLQSLERRVLFRLGLETALDDRRLTAYRRS